MSMVGFHALFPKVAQKESRAVTPFGQEDLPSHPFLFMESYCIDPACDCRRVLLSVIDTETRQQVATINYAFEPPGPPFEDEGQIFLDPINPQSDVSGALLELFEIMVGTDCDYHDRLVRHYRMCKRAVNDPKHPTGPEILATRRRYGLSSRQQPFRRGAKIGRNDPCPCGSARKYKMCCCN